MLGIFAAMEDSYQEEGFKMDSKTTLEFLAISTYSLTCFGGVSSLSSDLRCCGRICCGPCVQKNEISIRSWVIPPPSNCPKRCLIKGVLITPITPCGNTY